MFKETQHILGARDVRRAIVFYTEKLGFKLAFGGEGAEPDAEHPNYVGYRRDAVELQMQFQYPTPTELRAANVITAGREWDEARADLTRQLRDSLGTTLTGVRLSDEGLDALLDCEVSDYIKWLNTTDCPYLYDQATTSLAGHREEQRACLNRVGSAAKLREIDFGCTKRYLPNDYSIYSELFTNTFAARFDRHHPFSPSAQRVGACVAGRYLTELTRAGCRPMNLEASTAAGLFATDCVHKLKPTLERRVPGILRGCEAAAAP
jgi:catechol 2,3-dioxygenase-like lactoylglutathione lyase family enzyme